MNFARWVISIAALLLVLLVGVGFALSGEWSSTRETTTDLSVEVLWPRIADLRAWEDWAAVGQVEATYSDPASGVGATRAWDSPEWGQGEVRITFARTNRELRYEALIEEGAILIEGRIQLVPHEGGPTRIIWTETGDFGWNPFLAYIALGMERTQGAILAEGLRALTGAPEGSPVP